MKNYKYEIGILAVGFIISIIELFLKIEYGLFILALTFILDLALLGIRVLIVDFLKEKTDIYKSLYAIKDPYWREEGERMWRDLKDQLHDMSDGDRVPKSIFFEERRLINNAKKTIFCTYFADSIIKLQMRSNELNPAVNPLNSIHAEYKELFSSNQQYNKSDKKRVFILDQIPLNEETKKLIDRVEQANGFGFENRYVLYSIMKEQGVSRFGNMVLADGRECTLCTDRTNYPDDYFSNPSKTEKELEYRDIVDETKVNDYLRIFKTVWNVALPYNKFVAEYFM